MALGNMHSKSHCRSWLVTGASGLVGREVLSLLFERTQDSVSVLLRRRAGKIPKERLNSLLADIGHASAHGRITPYAGDISRERLGLSSEDWARLASQTTHILHLAADTSFEQPLAKARRTNLEGTRWMLALADEARMRGVLRRMLHISTAYVVGGQRGLTGPDLLTPEGPFRNTYERTKTEAEILVRHTIRQLPVSILRPGIVVGHSQTGAFHGFGSIYPAIYACLNGLPLYFGRRDAALDLVPVDYVAEAILHFANIEVSEERTYILAGGDRTAVTLADFRTMLSTELGGRSIRLLPPYLLKSACWLARCKAMPSKWQRLVLNAQSYLPYLTRNPRFDVSATERALEGTGIMIPPIETYLPRLLDYCLALGWGKGSLRLAKASAFSNCFPPKA